MVMIVSKVDVATQVYDIHHGAWVGSSIIGIKEGRSKWKKVSIKYRFPSL